MLLRIVLQDALSEVTKIYPSLKLRVVVDDISALLMEKNREVAEIEEIERGSRRQKMPQIVSEKVKEGKSKMIASCGFLENEPSQFSKGGVTLADSVETLGVDLRTRVKRLEAKEKARRKKVQGWVLDYQEEMRLFQKNYMKLVSRSCFHAGMMPARPWEAQVGMSPIQAAAAGKKSTTSLSLFMEAYGIEVEEELSTMTTL